MVTAPPLLTHVFPATKFSIDVLYYSMAELYGRRYGSMLRYDRRGAPAANPPLLAWLGWNPRDGIVRGSRCKTIDSEAS